jgi:hypothetical protein
LRRAPEAGTESVADLVDHAQKGKIRIPELQRPLKWTTDDVIALFDSIYRGLPVGSLLFWKRKGAASQVRLGPLSVTAPELTDAWWVVDGQQRLTSLAAGLARPLPLPSRTDSRDAFVIYFDPTTGRFESPTRDGNVPDEWVPLPALLDASALQEWIHGWAHAKEAELRRRVFEAGARIRDYKLPRYVVDAPDDEEGRSLLREIFFRVNKSGRPLDWAEVHDALYGGSGRAPSTTRELAEQLATLGMGRPDQGLLTNCLVALRGLDVTRPLAEHHRRDPDAVRGAVVEALPVLRQALAFLTKRAAIPHLRLLPRTMILEVLTRFFAKHPEPSARTLDLLVRWVWRALTGEHGLDERTLERRAIAAVGDDEEDSVQAMLRLVPRKPPEHFALPPTFDARTAESRVALLALASLSPRRFSDGQPLDIAALIDENDVDAFAQIVRPGPDRPSGAGAPENRILHAGPGTMRRLIIERVSSLGFQDLVLQSHAITPSCAQALADGHVETFLAERRARIEAALRALALRLGGWQRGDRDRPTIGHILRSDDGP